VARAIERQIGAFMQVQALEISRDPDIRPWISPRYDIEAVQAFLHGVQYVYRHEVGASASHERAIALDPSFIAPRVWLVPSAVSAGDEAALGEHRRRLEELVDEASPFEQSMIAWVGAVVERDPADQIRQLEVALRYAPNNNIVLVNLALARFELRDYRGALEALSLPLERWHYPSIFGLAARCAIFFDDLERADTLLQAGLHAEPVDPEIYALLEATALFRGDVDGALAYRTQLARRQRELAPEVFDPDLGAVYRHLADRARREGGGAIAEELERRSAGTGSA